MRKPNYHFGIFFLLLNVLVGCAPFSQLVRHSDPLTPEQHMQLGRSYEEQGLISDAKRQYNDALQRDNKYIPALIAKGNIFFAAGDLKKAAACYRQVLRLDRAHAGANNNLAMVTLRLGRDLDQAAQFAQTALRQAGPLRPYVLETLASIYMRQGRVDEARNVLNEADSLAFSDNQPLCHQISETREMLEASLTMARRDAR